MSNRNEIWKPIWGYTGLYEVSNMGRVRSLYFLPSRMLKPIGKDGGYRWASLHDKYGKFRQLAIHRLVWKAFMGTLTKDLVIHHKNAQKTDNRLTNLAAVTQSENMRQSALAKKRRGSKPRPSIRIKPRGTWKAIPGYKGLYEISTAGQVWVLPRTITLDFKRARSHQRSVGGILFRLDVPNIRGYLGVSLKNYGKSTKHQIHRLVVETFIGRIRKGLVVDHKNGNRIDNRVANLRIVSVTENNRFMQTARRRKKKS